MDQAVNCILSNSSYIYFFSGFLEYGIIVLVLSNFTFFKSQPFRSYFTFTYFLNFTFIFPFTSHFNLLSFPLKETSGFSSVIVSPSISHIPPASQSAVSSNKMLHRVRRSIIRPVVSKQKW